MPGLLVIPPNIELYFTRHARSLENDGDILTVDSPLSISGRIEASLLNGHFDYVICSPMRRCQETLHYSGIGYDHITIDRNFREKIYLNSSRLLLEHESMWEGDDTFEKRVRDFQGSLVSLFHGLSADRRWKILLVGHAYFFNYWMGHSVFSRVDHARIIRILSHQESIPAQPRSTWSLDVD